MLDILPIELIILIVEFISDYDFFNLIKTCKYLLEFSNSKKLTNAYQLSKIEHVKDIFKFSNIIYDYETFDILKIPIKINKIILCYGYCDKINNINLLPNLREIQINSFFSDSEFIMNIPDTIINKYNIIILTLINYFNKILLHDFVLNEYLPPINWYHYCRKQLIKIEVLKNDIDAGVPLSKNIMIDIMKLTETKSLYNFLPKIDILKDYYLLHEQGYIGDKSKILKFLKFLKDFWIKFHEINRINNEPPKIINPKCLK